MQNRSEEFVDEAGQKRIIEFWYAEAVGYSFAMTGAPMESNDFGGDGTWIFVPEPGTLSLFALGMAALAAGTRMRKK